MARKKRAHLADLHQWAFVLQEPKQLARLRGERREEPCILELGCGRGEMSLGLAQMNPNALFLGMDCKGSRLWHGAKATHDLGLKNLFWIPDRIEQLMQWFPAECLDEIWLTFPDPHPRAKKAKHRLSSELFLNLYQRILKPKGLLHLKTDDADLFEYSLSIAKQLNWHLVNSNWDHPLGPIQTTYERRFRAEGKPIKLATWENVMDK